MRPEVVILLLVGLGSCVNGQADNRTELHIAFITSFEGEYDSSVTVPAVQLATATVNSDASVLPGYKLVVELIDNLEVARNFANSKCDRHAAQQTFLEQITSGRQKVALIGCGCSLATEPVAEISRFWNITHISYTPNSDYLSNRELFPTLWKTHPQESRIRSSIIAILRQYNWTRMKIITQNEDLFTSTSSALMNELTMVNTSLLTVQAYETTFSTQINVFENLTESDLFREEFRVYFLNMYPVHARRIMCRAAVNQRVNPTPEYHYPGYTWITLGWYQEDWWRQGDRALDCSDDVLEPLIRNTLAIQLGNSTLDSSSQTDVGLTAAEFETTISNMSDYEAGSFSSVAYLAYDAIWTLALGIKRALPRIELGLVPDLSNFDYRRNGSAITEIITNELSQSTFSFVGVSGEVKFDINGSRVPAPAKIFIYRQSNDTMASVQRQLIAMDNGSTFEYVDGENNNTTWPDGVPLDGTPVVVLNTFYMPIYIIYDIFVVLGIIFAIVCLLFNFIFRKRKIVRLISPNLNYFIILGALLLYISVAFFVFPTTNPTLVTFACHFRAWAQALGYFMCFGTIVAKMWRVYFIFNHPQVQVTKQRQRAIKDWHLMMIVLTLCTVVVIFFTAVAIFGQYKATEVQDNERPDTRNEENNILYDSHTLVCEGPRDIFWIVAFLGYILITQLISVVLAFRTRKVKIKALNDAKYVALIIYITTFIIITMIVCAILLSERLNADGAVFGGLLYIFTTTVLSVLFIPKMVILYKDPKGEKIFERTYSVSQATATNPNQIDDLEKHCKELENRLGRYETVAPYRSASQSSIKKFSSSTGFLASLPLSTGPTPSSPIYNVNPTLSLPVTPVKYTSDMNDTKLTNGTSGYLSDSPPSDKGKQLLTLELNDRENARAVDFDVDAESGHQEENTL